MLRIPYVIKHEQRFDALAGLSHGLRRVALIFQCIGGKVRPLELVVKHS